VLEQLGREDASITALAERFHMSITGMKKHASRRHAMVRRSRAPRVRGVVEARPVQAVVGAEVDGHDAAVL